MSPGNPPAPGEARGPPKSDLFDMCLILFAFFCTYWPLLAFEIILGFEARRYTRELGTPGSPGVPGSRHYRAEHMRVGSHTTCSIVFCDRRGPFIIKKHNIYKPGSVSRNLKYGCMLCNRRVLRPCGVFVPFVQILQSPLIAAWQRVVSGHDVHTVATPARKSPTPLWETGHWNGNCSGYNDIGKLVLRKPDDRAPADTSTLMP